MSVIAHVLVMVTIVALGAREAHQETDTVQGLVRGGPTAGPGDTTTLAVVLIGAVLSAQCRKTLTLLPIRLSELWRLKSKVTTQNMRKLYANLKKTIPSIILFSIEM